MDCSIAGFVTRVTRGQNAVLCRISGCGHFWSSDKDGGHTIRSAMAQNPMIYADFTAPPSTEPELLSLKFYIARIRNFAYFCEKLWKILKFSIRTTKLMQTMQKHFFGKSSTVRACMLPELHTVKVLFYAKLVGVVTSGLVTKMAVTPFDPSWHKTSQLYLL